MKQPEDVADGWAARLSKVLGDESWRGLYSESPQGELFGDVGHERDPGIDELVHIYKSKLAGLFGERFMEQSRILKNSKNAPLFDFLFCVGNAKGIVPAKRIAEYILKGM